MTGDRISFATHPFVAGVDIHYAMKGSSANNVLFLGVGQSGANLRAIIKAMPRDSVAVAAFPYHRTKPGAMGDVSTDAVGSLLKKLSPKTPCAVIAESQAAPAVVLAAHAWPELFRSLTLLEPLGFNRDALGDSADERYRSLMRRSQAFWRHPNQSLSIRANRDTLWEIAKRSIPAWKRLRPDYTFGANQDVASEARELATHLPVTIYADKSDGLFPYGEILANIQGSGIKLVEVHAGSHINRATPKGIAELNAIFTSPRG